MRQNFIFGIFLLAAWLNATPSSGDGCSDAVGPDVIVGELPAIVKFGNVGSIAAYAVATDACNVGDEPAAWDADTNQHPVIAQQMYRLRDGRFTQIGMSWAKHGFLAITGQTCCTCTPPATNQMLGVGCSDIYTTAWNGFQEGFQGLGGMGQRSEINPSTGVFPFPYATLGQSGDTIYKRIQVHNDDFDPGMNDGALYFVEGQYITPDDTLAGNHFNNVSYRRMFVTNMTFGGWNLFLTGSTFREQPAILAWQAADPSVLLSQYDVPDDGRFILGSRCTDKGDGAWHYEYALYNMNSNRAAAELRIPFSAETTLTNVGFSDIDYHSGEVYDNQDWEFDAAADPSFASWRVAGGSDHALRWGALYNFWFDADQAPETRPATVGLFLPGDFDEIFLDACAPMSASPTPGDWDGDGDVDLFDFNAFTNCTGDPNLPPPAGCETFDFDKDNDVDFVDYGGFQRAFGQ